MAITLPFDLSVQEMRVLQEYRRIGTESLPQEAIAAIKHPAGDSSGLAASLAASGYVTKDESGYALTQKARDFLAIDVKPEPPSAPRDK